jgi:Rieske Fe-S protein
MSQKQSRRDFLGMAFGGVAAVGGVFALGAMKKSWDPLPSVQAAGFTTIDLSPIEPGQIRTIEWRKNQFLFYARMKIWSQTMRVMSLLIIGATV